MDTQKDKKLHKCEYAICNTFSNEDIDFNYLNIDYPVEHNHDFWEILIVTKGRILNKINRQDIIMPLGTAVLIRPDDIHSIYIDDKSGTHHLSISIKDEYMKRLLSSYSDDLYDKILALPSLPVLNLSVLEINRIISSIMYINTKDIKIGTRTFELKLIAEGFINKTLDHVFSSNQNLPDWFTNFLFKLSDPFINVSDVNELTKYTPYSYSHLAPLFKRLTGKTILEYVIESKMKGAQDLLKTTDMTITEISTKLNYESFSYFNRTFKKYSKMSPSEYRKKYKL